MTDRLSLVPLVSIRRITAVSIDTSHWRPKTRADCAYVPRPCPYVGCRHHLDSDEHDANDPRATIDRLRAPVRDESWPFALVARRPSCSLDVVDAGNILDLDQIKELTGLWHNTVEDALASGLAKMAADPELRDYFADLMDRDEARHPLEAAQRWSDAASDADE